MSPTERPKVLLMGGSGFVGNALGLQLVREGFDCFVLTRSPQNTKHKLAFPATLFCWNKDGSLPAEALDVAAVVNLAGAGIADGRWTSRAKKKILSSRVNATGALVKAIADLPPESRPDTVVQASAIGIYQGGEEGATFAENGATGSGFLADVCQQWEQAAQPLQTLTRLTVLRIGVVLGWEGGAFQKIWQTYAAGFGGTLGSGQQWMNWIHLDDLIKLMVHAIKMDSFQGVYNAVAPGNLTNQQCHEALCPHTNSFRAMKVPAAALKIILGEQSHLVLDHLKVVPERLTQEQFEFSYPDFNSALKELLKERMETGNFYMKTQQWLPLDQEALWAFMSAPVNLERITPPWLNFHIENSSTETIELHTKLKYSLKMYGIRLRWASDIAEWDPQSKFADNQLKGPYKRWYHRHYFFPLGNGTLIEDRIEFTLPLAPFSAIALPIVAHQLTKIFDYRKRAMVAALGLTDKISS